MFVLLLKVRSFITWLDLTKLNLRNFTFFFNFSFVYITTSCLFKSLTYYKTWIYPRKRTCPPQGANLRQRNKAVVNASSLVAPSDCCSRPPRRTSLCSLSTRREHLKYPKTSSSAVDSSLGRPLLPELPLSGAPPPQPNTNRKTQKRKFYLRSCKILQNFVIETAVKSDLVFKQAKNT